MYPQAALKKMGQRCWGEEPRVEDNGLGQGRSRGGWPAFALWAKALACRSVGAGEPYPAGEADLLQLPPCKAKGRQEEVQPSCYRPTE